MDMLISKKMTEHIDWLAYSDNLVTNLKLTEQRRRERKKKRKKRKKEGRGEAIIGTDSMATLEELLKILVEWIWGFLNM